jgi:hypothetical protein
MSCWSHFEGFCDRPNHFVEVIFPLTRTDFSVFSCFGCSRNSFIWKKSKKLKQRQNRARMGSARDAFFGVLGGAWNPNGPFLEYAGFQNDPKIDPFSLDEYHICVKMGSGKTDAKNDDIYV